MDAQAASSSFLKAPHSASARSAHASSASWLCTQRTICAGSPGSGMGLSSHAIWLERSRPQASSASSQRSNRSNSIRLLGSTWRKPGSSSTKGPPDSGTVSKAAPQLAQRLASEPFVLPQERHTRFDFNVRSSSTVGHMLCDSPHLWALLTSWKWYGLVLHATPIRWCRQTPYSCTGVWIPRLLRRFLNRQVD
jgi:hypothetical protein